MVRLSYSAIKLLRLDPAEYKRLYILQQPRRKDSDEQIEGSLLHDLALTPAAVADKYVISPKKPSSPFMLKYLETFANLIDSQLMVVGSLRQEDISAHQRQAYQQSGYSESEESVYKKAEEFEDYFKFCLSSTGKHVITAETKEKIQALITPKLLGLLWLDAPLIKGSAEGSILHGFVSSSDVNRELLQRNHFFWEMPFSIGIVLNSKTTGRRNKFTLVGSMDALKIDTEGHIITIKDLKKVKDILKFQHTYKDRMLDLQAGIYTLAVKQWLEQSKLDYKVAFEFVVVDEKARAVGIPVSEATLKIMEQKAWDDLDIAYWHIHNKNYEVPYEFLTKSVYL